MKVWQRKQLVGRKRGAPPLTGQFCLFFTIVFIFHVGEITNLDRPI